MHRIMRRFALPTILVVGAVALAACGGSSNKSSAYSGTGASASSSGGGGGGGSALSNSDYATQVNTALVPVRDAQTAANGSTDPSVYDKLSGAIQTASSMISGLNPPSAVSDLNTQMTTALDGMATAAKSVGSSLANHDNAGAQAGTTAYASAQKTYNAVLKQMSAAGINFGSQ
jgi:hypothetical protein